MPSLKTEIFWTSYDVAEMVLGFHLSNIKMKLQNSIYLTMSIFVTNLEEQRCIGYTQTYVSKIATISTELSPHFSIIFVFVDISHAQHTSLPRAGKFPRGTVHPISPRYFSLVVDTLV